MLDFIIKGGVFIYPIIICSIISLTIFMEKIWSLKRNRVIPVTFLDTIERLLKKEDIAEALKLCGENSSSISRIFSAGIKNYGKRREIIKERIEEVGRREAIVLGRYVEALATIASVSTLLGLLGTIAGMIKIFSVISLQSVVNPSTLAGGISEALYTTAAGLTVAIPTLIFYRYLSSKSNSLIVEMEECSAQMVELIKEKE
ncbi:MAG: MotA/TolQ/ExbB proton channel family protein [Deltaproteobacteria bacterium]|nr:MotA/TolQ/ExbB proton channel family protein [Deltaproteobacteria bacterium]